MRALLLLALMLALAGCVQDTGTTGTVERVVDGDTVEVALDNGTIWTVRLIGVDTPEVHVSVDPAQYGFPHTETVKDCLRSVGSNASRFVERSVSGRRVRLTFDPAVGRVGEYGRVLAYLHADGTLVNRVLIARGLARVYEGPFRYRATFGRLEAGAMRDSKGLWACGQVVR